MDHLLVVASPNGIPDSTLQSLRLAGWRITVTADIVSAKQLLQKGSIAGVIVDLKPSHDPERLKVLRYVHEFCPNTMVVMVQKDNNGVTQGPGAKLTQTLDTVEDARVQARAKSLALYRLSPAQQRIADLVAQAYPNREIAKRLKIKEQSVRNELSRIFRKMGVWNRVELALLMRKDEATTPQNPKEPWNDVEPIPPAVETQKPATV